MSVESFRILFWLLFSIFWFLTKTFLQSCLSLLLWLFTVPQKALSTSAVAFAFKSKAGSSHGCDQRGSYPETYCACTTTSCAPLELQPVLSGQVNVYVSSMAGERFAFSRIPLHKQAEVDDCTKDTSCSYYRKPTLVSIQVNPNQTHQKIEGFGGAMTDAAAESIYSLPKKLQEQIIEDCYGSKGLQYSMMRTTIGGTDFSSRVYTLDDHEDDFELEHFALQKEDIEWKIPLIKQALQFNKDIKLFGSSWSPPAWMKTNKKVNGKGSLIGSPGGKYYKIYAKYLVKYFQEYQKHNITFWGMTTQNEPFDGFVPGFPFNALGLSAEDIRDFVKLDLGPALEKEGFTTDNFHILIIDDQRVLLPSWTNRIMKDPDAAKYVYGAAFHWYLNFMIPPSFLDTVHEQHPDLVLISSEACTGAIPINLPIYKHVYLGSWGRAEEYGIDIIEDLNHWTNGWIDWNFALNLEGGPNWVQNYVDAPIIVNASSQEYYRQPMYYALAHFTKFLPPGSVRLHHTQNVSSILDWLRVKIYSVVLRDTSGQNVLVVLNGKDNEADIVVHVSKEKAFQHRLPSRSIATFVWRPESQSI